MVPAVTDATSDDLGALYWDSLANLSLDKVVVPGDALWVDTAAARGQFTFDGVLRLLGFDPKTHKLMKPGEQKYILFAGHVGCGKSTELRRFISLVNKPEGYCVVFVDSYLELDPNNLQYVDVLLALGSKLCATLSERGIDLAPGFLRTLQNWFKEHITSEVVTAETMAELSSGLSAEPTIPLIGKLFAKLSMSMKGGATFKDEVRLRVRNNYTDFARSFNLMIQAAEQAVVEADLGRKLLFVVDGTDRLNGEDTCRFFNDDVHQLKQVAGNFIYTARIDLLRESNQSQQHFSTMTVPMMKLREKGDETRLPLAYETLRTFVHKRVDARLFDSLDTVDHLIEMSGGHPRDLLRLLMYTFQSAENERYDRKAADEAVKILATEYRRLLQEEDYDLLVKVDVAADPPNGQEVQRLLKNLAVLEYNSFWWLSHPAVRTLPGYKRAWEAAHGG